MPPTWSRSSRPRGASAATVQAQLQEVKTYKDSPFLSAAMTFLEPFPVGLLITLISAAVLRRKAERATTDIVAYDDGLIEAVTGNPVSWVAFPFEQQAG